MEFDYSHLCKLIEKQEGDVAAAYYEVCYPISTLISTFNERLDIVTRLREDYPALDFQDVDRMSIQESVDWVIRSIAYDFHKSRMILGNYDSQRSIQTSCRLSD